MRTVYICQGNWKQVPCRELLVVRMTGRGTYRFGIVGDLFVYQLNHILVIPNTECRRLLISTDNIDSPLSKAASRPTSHCICDARVAIDIRFATLAVCTICRTESVPIVLGCLIPGWGVCCTVIGEETRCQVCQT